MGAHSYPLMADSTNAANLPDGYPAYAGYIDGAWPSFRYIVRRFWPSAHCLGITTGHGRARIIDVEFGDATLLEAVALVNERLQEAARWRDASLVERRQLPEPIYRPGPYIAIDRVDEAVSRLMDLTSVKTRFDFSIWACDWTGELLDELPIGVDALQCIGGENRLYDISQCAVGFLATSSRNIGS